MPGYIYLYHFTRKVCPDRHTCQHYIGHCDNLHQRNRQHQQGNAARLTQVAIQRGIKIEIVRVWKGTRTDERQLKNQKNGPALCPICTNHPRPIHCLSELSKEEIEELITLPF